MNQSLSHDQLNKIAEGISVLLPGILENVLSGTKTTSREGSIHRKLFVGSLGLHTTSETLHRIFSAYGELEEAFVVIDKSGISKEYGFVIFQNVRSALMALKEPYKRIDGKMTVTKVANSRTKDGENESLRTIYVSNVPRDMFPGKLLEYFSSYGVIEKGPFGFDKETGKSKGYAIFVYKTLEGAKTAIYEPSKCVDGQYLTCEMANPRTKKKPRTIPNLCNYGTGFYDRYKNERSRFDSYGSRPEVSQVGTQYVPCQGNGQMYAQKCDCGLVSNGNIHGGLSPTVMGLNHMGSGLCSNMGHADFSFWSSDFPRHKPLWF
ncbi:UBP1-associated protein 2C-like [Lycium barbarum]|uniref:UBP1-associated protein 2C-like n=1 Tax=Lycium barbarum TaxID=112863 RepID=UPI00293EF6E9|nr:UBP1-associated protein 2C-like [Lycium barbarum]